LPFTALLAVFFAIVSVIHDQHLFAPVIGAVLAQEGTAQEVLLFASNGLLSALSDNVFVASVYVTEVAKAFEAGQITREQFDALAVAINTGTNIPSVATPNGQAAFLFLLTSALAPLIRLSYGRMVWMALPYTVVLTAIALAATILY
jgi:NhaB family Na+:H+ antiporter